MKIKGLIDECFGDYKKPSMYIAFPTCSFKCDRALCQNSALALGPNIEISKEEICERYLKNPITSAFVFAGLEPFDSSLSMIPLINCIRNDYKIEDDIVIYTGYTKEELCTGRRAPNFQDSNLFKSEWESLKGYKNIIVKYGRFYPNEEGHYDNVLGVELASKNQYAEVISNEN